MFSVNIPVQTFTGTALTPTPTNVIADGLPVTYTLGDWGNNTNVGTATVTISGTGNFEGSQSVPFNILPVVLDGKPTITGSVRVGQILTVNTALLNADFNIGSDTSYRYRWMADGVEIGADSDTYIIRDADVGKAITVTVTASGNYTGSQSSVPTLPVPEKEVISISIVTQPQLVYVGGELLDLSALEIKVVYEDDSIASLTYDAPGLSYTANSGTEVAHNSTMLIFSAHDRKPIKITYFGKACDTNNLTVYASPVLSTFVTDLTYESAELRFGVKRPDTRYTVSRQLQIWNGDVWENVPGAFPEDPLDPNYESQQKLQLTSLFEDTEYEYRLWVRNDTTGKEYTTPLTFRTKLDVSSGVVVGGTVIDPDDPTDIIISIEHGNTVIAAVTVIGNGLYDFTFTNIPDGVYNIVADNGHYKVTTMIWVSGENVTDISVNMASGKTQSVIKILGSETPPAAVNGLPDLFDDINGVLDSDDKALLDAAGTVELRLEVSKNNSPADAGLIRARANGQTIGLYLDLSVIKAQFCDSGSLLGEKTVTTLNGNLIFIMIELPDEIKDKPDLTIYRVHNNVAEHLSSSPNSFGETAVLKNGYAEITACRFSTFGFAFTPDPEPDPPPTPTPTPPPEPAPTPPPAQEPTPTTPQEIPEILPPRAPKPVPAPAPEPTPEPEEDLADESVMQQITLPTDSGHPLDLDEAAPETPQAEDEHPPVTLPTSDEGEIHPQPKSQSGLSRLLNFAQGPVLNMILDIEVGAQILGRSISVEATGLMPHSEVTVTIHSTPRLVGTGMTDENGDAGISTAFPDDLERGIHVVIAEGLCPDGYIVQAVAPFEIDGNGILTAFTEPAQLFDPIDPGDPRIARSLKAGVPLYDAKGDPETVAQVAVTFGLLGGIAAIAGVAKKRSKKAIFKNDDEEEIIEKEPEAKWGDKYGLWKISLFRKTSDTLGVKLQEKTAKTSFILNRFTGDGSWARAMFGSGGFILWLLGIALGVYSSMQTGYNAMPPGIMLVLVIVALGILDSGAGFLAWLTITILAIANGNAAGVYEIRTLVGMFTLFATMLILGGTRPLRRKYDSVTRGQVYCHIPAGECDNRPVPMSRFVFDRLADYIMPTIYIILSSSAVLRSINGLSGLEFFVEEQINTIKYVAIGAYWVRMLLEDLADYAFPVRNKTVRPVETDEQSKIFQFGAMLLYAGLFMVVASPFFGFGIAVVFILALDVVPWLLSFIKDRFPNSEFLYRYYPGTSSPQIGFVLMLISIGLAALVASNADYRGASAAMIIVAIPYALAEVPSLFGREGIPAKDGWAKRLVEFTCWCGFAAIALLIV